MRVDTTITVPSPQAPPVLFLVGATASGKTAASQEVALHYDVEVINADSRQVYRFMDIGTAKPTVAERAVLPHHLLDVADPDEEYSLALFLAQARQSIAEVHERGVLPLVVGGTGQYVWALAEGWEVPNVPPLRKVRDRLEREAQEMGGVFLHRRLHEIDPDAAMAIDPRNVRRLVRALEVIHATGKPFSSQRRRSELTFTPHLLGLWVSRAELYRRIDERVGTMLAAGWLDEIRALLDRGYSQELSAFSSAGYRELAGYLAGSSTWDDALDKTKVAVHRLARRQNAWFRQGDPHIQWCASDKELRSAIEALGQELMLESP